MTCPLAPTPLPQGVFAWKGLIPGISGGEQES